MNEHEEMYEEERLEKYSKDHYSDSEEKLFRGIIVDVLTFMNKVHQSDDILSCSRIPGEEG